MSGTAIVQLAVIAAAFVEAVVAVILLIRMQRQHDVERRRTLRAVATLGGVIAVLAAVALLLRP